jgi:hypothetical protein
MTVLFSNDKAELKKDIAKVVKEFPQAEVGPITKAKKGWFQVTITK